MHVNLIKLALLSYAYNPTKCIKNNKFYTYSQIYLKSLTYNFIKCHYTPFSNYDINSVNLAGMEGH